MSGLLGGLGRLGNVGNLLELVKLSGQFKTENGAPNLKVIASTLAGFVTPAVAAWLADIAGVTDVRTVEALILGLVSAGAVFAAGYFKRPAPGDGVIHDPKKLPPVAPTAEGLH